MPSFNVRGPSCHGPEGRGGTHQMHMRAMKAPEIHYAALASMPELKGRQCAYDSDDLRKTVEQGRHPDGEDLEADMPHWTTSEVLIVAVLVGGIGAAAWRYFGGMTAVARRRSLSRCRRCRPRRRSAPSPSMPTVSPAIATAAAAQPKGLRWFMAFLRREFKPHPRSPAGEP